MIKFIEAGLASNHRSKGTRSENIMAAILEASGIAFARNAMLGAFNVDLLLPGRIVLECFGDYWHCNPEIYAPDFYNKSLRCTAEEKWARDKSRCDALGAMGYRVFIVWERDVKSRPNIIRLTTGRVLHAAHQ